jgi:hypothetical protein
VKKSKLIAMLNAIPGNPDIILWSGMVGDWMDISAKPVEGDLVRQSLRYVLEMQRLRDCQREQDWNRTLPEETVRAITKGHSKCYPWEITQFVTQEDVKAGDYQRKRVVFLNAKRRGVSTFDRLGTIEY